MPTGARDVEHVAVDQEEVGAGIVDDAQQREAGQPGGVGFPFEPGQMLRHLGRRHQVFLDVVEAAAMHLPFLAERAGGQARPLPQPEIERDEIEGRADPGDAGDDVQPAHGKAQPVPEDREIEHARPLLGHDFTACAANGKRRHSTMTFKKIWKIIGSLSKVPEKASSRHGLSRQHRRFRARRRTRQSVGGRPRHAHFAGRRLQPHQGTGEASRRAAVQPHDAAADADRARHRLLRRRQAGAGGDRRGRGRRQRAVRPAARHHPRHRAARARPPARSPPAFRISTTNIPTSRCGCGSPTTMSTS